MTNSKRKCVFIRFLNEPYGLGFKISNRVTVIGCRHHVDNASAIILNVSVTARAI